MHQLPPVHPLFEGNYVICNFVPHKVDCHPLALPVLYYHSNVDSDEEMFYCGHNYEALKGHPTYSRVRKRSSSALPTTEATAEMCDTRAGYSPRSANSGQLRG